MRSLLTLALFQASSAAAFVIQPAAMQSSMSVMRSRSLSAFSKNLATRMAATDAVATSDTLFKDWKASTAFLFPGQGAQYVGMAGKLVAEVPKAKEMFQQASEVLGYDLLKLCLEGPKERLDSTVISQPAIYVASLAAVEKLRSDAGQGAIDQATVAAGLSLGEYSTLTITRTSRYATRSLQTITPRLMPRAVMQASIQR